MVKRKATFLAPLALAAAALPGIWVGSASATGTSNGGVVHLYQVDTTLGSQLPSTVSQTDAVTLTGALADYGFDYEATGSSNINVLALQQGAIALDLTDFGSGTQPSPIENPSNCSFTNVIVGPVYIRQDELKTSQHPRPPGIYKDLHGTFYVKAIFAGVAPRNSDRSCNFSQMDSTSTGLDFAKATGDVFFSS
jgi:hypothetical protein